MPDHPLPDERRREELTRAADHALRLLQTVPECVALMQERDPEACASASAEAVWLAALIGCSDVYLV